MTIHSITPSINLFINEAYSESVGKHRHHKPSDENKLPDSLVCDIFVVPEVPVLADDKAKLDQNVDIPQHEELLVHFPHHAIKPCGRENVLILPSTICDWKTEIEDNRGMNNFENNNQNLLIAFSRCHFPISSIPSPKSRSMDGTGTSNILSSPFSHSSLILPNPSTFVLQIRQGCKAHQRHALSLNNGLLLHACFHNSDSQEKVDSKIEYDSDVEQNLSKNPKIAVNSSKNELISPLDQKEGRYDAVYGAVFNNSKMESDHIGMDRRICSSSACLDIIECYVVLSSAKIFLASEQNNQLRIHSNPSESNEGNRFLYGHQWMQHRDEPIQESLSLLIKHSKHHNDSEEVHIQKLIEQEIRDIQTLLTMLGVLAIVLILLYVIIVQRLLTGISKSKKRNERKYHLKHESKKNDMGPVIKPSIQIYQKHDAMTKNTLKKSSRTLTALEQERHKFRNVGKLVHKIYNKIKNQIRNAVKMSHTMTKSVRFHIDNLYRFACQASKTFCGKMLYVKRAIHLNHDFLKKKMSLNYFLRNFKKYNNCFKTRDFFKGINKTTFDYGICESIKELIEQGFKISYITPNQIKDESCLEHHISGQTIATINLSVAAKILSMYPITSFPSKLFFRQKIHSKTSSFKFLYIYHSSSFPFRPCYEKIKKNQLRDYRSDTPSVLSVITFLNDPMQLDDKNKCLKLLQISSMRPNQNFKMKGDSNSSMHFLFETIEESNHSNRSFLTSNKEGKALIDSHTSPNCVRKSEGHNNTFLKGSEDIVEEKVKVLTAGLSDFVFDHHGNDRDITFKAYIVEENMKVEVKKETDRCTKKNSQNDSFCLENITQHANVQSFVFTKTIFNFSDVTAMLNCKVNNGTINQKYLRTKMIASKEISEKVEVADRCKFSISRLPQIPVSFHPDNHRFTTTYKIKQNKWMKISSNKIDNDNPNVITSHSKFEIALSEQLQADKAGNKAYHQNHSNISNLKMNCNKIEDGQSKLKTTDVSLTNNRGYVDTQEYLKSSVTKTCSSHKIQVDSRKQQESSVTNCAQKLQKFRNKTSIPSTHLHDKNKSKDFEIKHMGSSDRQCDLFSSPMFLKAKMRRDDSTSDEVLQNCTNMKIKKQFYENENITSCEPTLKLNVSRTPRISQIGKNKHRCVSPCSKLAEVCRQKKEKRSKKKWDPQSCAKIRLKPLVEVNKKINCWPPQSAREILKTQSKTKNNSFESDKSKYVDVKTIFEEYW